MRISTHILDTTRGRPAQGVIVRLYRYGIPDTWRQLAEDRTDINGRCEQLFPEKEFHSKGPAVEAGVYRLEFETGPYFLVHAMVSLYPTIQVTFDVAPGETHFHIPLLLSPNGYTTYRGS